MRHLFLWPGVWMPLLLRSLPGPTPAQVHFYLLRESLHGIGKVLRSSDDQVKLDIRVRGSSARNTLSNRVIVS